MKYRFLIVEDDVLISEHLKQIVLNQGHEVTEICSKESSALQSIDRCPPDFSFLDIQLLGDGLGINVGKRLQQLGIPFMFITSFSDKQTIQQAIDVQPKGYILKPFEGEEVSAAIERLLEFGRQSISIKSGGIKYNLPLNEIQFIRSENVYLEIHTDEKKYLIREKMSEFLSRASGSPLIQIHRSYAINSKKLTKKTKSSFFINKIEIPISKNYQKIAKDIFA